MAAESTTTSSNYNRSKSPNYRLRRAVAIGSVLLAAGLVVGKKEVDNYHSQQKQGALVKQIDRPIVDVAADLNSGKINPDDITVVTVDANRKADKEAAHLVPDVYKRGYDLSGIIRDQVGEDVHEGDQIVVPSSLVPHQEVQQNTQPQP